MGMTSTQTSPIRLIRRAKGMTVEQLASRAELASATVYRAERGIGRPTDETLDAIAGVLGVGVSDLREPTSTTSGNGRGRDQAGTHESPTTESPQIQQAAGLR